MVAPKAPENFFFIPLAHIASLPAQAVEHPNAILEPNLHSNATPTLSLLLTLHLTLPMTLTLIKTEYWDRASGGGNISYDWSGTSRMIHTLMALDKVKSACK